MSFKIHHDRAISMLQCRTNARKSAAAEKNDCLRWL